MPPVYSPELQIKLPEAYWILQQINARNQVEKELYGNGLSRKPILYFGKLHGVPISLNKILIKVMIDKLNEMDREQLMRVKDWYITAFGFFRDYAPNAAVRDCMDHYITSMDRFFAERILKGNKTAMRGFKMAFNDLIDDCRGLSPVDRKRLNDILREKFGYDLNDADKKQAKKIETILTRGKLRSDIEYYLAKEWVDHLLWTGVAGDEEKAKKLDELLGDYE